MQNPAYGMIYLIACAINGCVPESEVLLGLDLESVYNISKKHSVDALCFSALKKNKDRLSDELFGKWQNAFYLNIRKNVMFSVERSRFFSFCEENGIRYLPLKGILIQDIYPEGTRQMADNDILFDHKFDEQVKSYFESCGYKTAEYRMTDHDVYHKPPLSFEMHRELVSYRSDDIWKEYYKDPFDGLLVCNGDSCEYHFKDEDFYIFIMAHAYKHYRSGGTGVRNIVDCFLYYKSHGDMDRSYLDLTLDKLGILDYEIKTRSLAEKLFSDPKQTMDIASLLDDSEREMLEYYISSGTYGTLGHRVENRIKELSDGSNSPSSASKLKYVFKRLFPNKAEMERWCRLYAPFFIEHKSLFFLSRLYRILLPHKSKKVLLNEVKTVIRRKIDD